MGKKNRQRKKRNLIMIFLLTFSIVVAAGVITMAAYLWIMAPAKEAVSYHNNANEGVNVSKAPAVQDKTEQENDDGAPEEAEEPHGRYWEELNDPEYMAANNIYAKDANDAEAVTITFAGDILFDPNYAVMATMQQNGGEISGAIAPDLIREMQSADIMMVNNEFPYSDRGTPTEDKQFTFRAKPSYVSYMNDLGVDIVSLANNHAYDYGEEAFLDTMTTLEQAGITYIGAGTDLQSARRPAYYIVNDMKIAFIAATQIERNDYPDTKGATDSSAGVFRCMDSANLIETIKEAKENSDFVIVYLHWGTENEAAIDWLQEKQAPEAAEAGADLIIGAHPHCLQPIGVVQGVPVIYSLGNFWFNSRTIDTGLVKVVLTEEGLQSCQFIPCLQSGCKTTMLQGEEKERVLNYMRSISTDVQIDAEGYVTWQ